MARMSNAQGLLFAEIFTEEVDVQASSTNTSSTLKGWFGTQQVGQVKSLISNTVTEQKGVVTHTVGDSILSSFPDAQLALNAALGIQRRVAEAQTPARGSIVRVRIGLSYGPVRVFAGKVSGDAVTAAGILLEKAQPNEILADQAIRDAVKSGPETRLEACGVIEGITAYRVVSIAPAPRPPVEAATLPGRVADIPKAPAPTHAAEAAAPRAKARSSVVLKFAGTVRRFSASEGEIFIGRGKDVHVTVPVLEVSRKHAKIVWEENGMPHLVNLSQNGTCVRFSSTGDERMCTTKLALEEDGEIALCGRFSQVTSPDEIIAYTLSSA